LLVEHAHVTPTDKHVSCRATPSSAFPPFSSNISVMPDENNQLFAMPELHNNAGGLLFAVSSINL
jgi:hypothetical protein